MELSGLLQKEWLVVLAMASGAAFGLIGASRKGVPSAAAASTGAARSVLPEELAATDLPPVPSPWDDLPLDVDPASAEASGTGLSGEVLEQIDVGKYSYLRLNTLANPSVWTAVPLVSSRMGQRVKVAQAQLMTEFISSSLKRTFPSIYFGVLAQESSTPAGSIDAGLELPHPGPGVTANAVPIPKVRRADGPNGHTVAELNAMPADTRGKRVRVRAVVVKSTAGVLDRTFLHVRDGSGTAEHEDHDLTVTLREELRVGQEVLLEGTLELDKDFGSGYRYRVLLADATVVRD